MRIARLKKENCNESQRETERAHILETATFNWLYMENLDRAHTESN